MFLKFSRNTVVQDHATFCLFIVYFLLDRLLHACIDAVGACSLAALDRKITAELAPKHDEKDGEEVKRDEQPQQSQRVENPAQSSGSKESMVAEPIYMYASRRTFTGLR